MHARPIAIVFVLLALARAALAQPAETAKAHYEHGKALAAAGRLAEAYLEFEAGYAAEPRPAFLFNMGETARGMGNATAAPTGPLADTARRRLAELGIAQPPPRSASPGTGSTSPPGTGSTSPGTSL